MRAFEFALFTRLNIYRAQLFEVSAEGVAELTAIWAARRKAKQVAR
jgi:hypothetical protein